MNKAWKYKLIYETNQVIWIIHWIEVIQSNKENNSLEKAYSSIYTWKLKP